MKPKCLSNFFHKVTFNTFNKNYELKNKIISQQKKIFHDLIAKITILAISSLSLIATSLLIGFVVGQTFSNINFFNWLKMLGDSKWLPNSESFGILSFVVATFWVALIVMIIAVPLSLLTSLFICEFLPNRLKKITLTLVELLSGIPSVVFGAFGLMTIGPIFMKMGASSKENMMTASFILSIMALPTIISLCVNAINSVPKSYLYASLALGISRTHTSFKVIFSAALPKIIGAVIFGFGRVIGETMAVVMIAGNSTTIPNFDSGALGFLFSSVSTLAGVIGLEIGEAVNPQHLSALYGIGLFLFILVSIINFVVLVIYKRNDKKLKGHKRARIYNLKKINLTPTQLSTIIYAKTIKNRTWKILQDYIRLFFMFIACVITMGLIVWIIGDIIINGIFNLSGTAGSGVFNFDVPALFSMGDDGYLSIIVMTCLLVIITITIAMPLGIVCAIYLQEYAKDSTFGAILRFVLNTLASTPSIIFGMFGFSLFIIFLGIGASAIAASLTLTIVVLPLIIKAVEDTLKSVPNEYREASLALGASKFETIRKVVIPVAISGIITSMILSMGRIIGESAPVYLTLGSTVNFPNKGFLSSGQTLTTHILLINKESTDANKLGMMYQTALITVALIFILNFLAKHFQKSLTTGMGVKTQCSIALIKAKMIAFKNKRSKKQQAKS